MGRKYDLHRLKHAVTIAQVLSHYGLSASLGQHRGELVGPCPLPGHAGDRDNRTAFPVAPKKGLWHCLTHCGGGDMVSLVAGMEGGDYAAAARVLARLEEHLPPSLARSPQAAPIPPSRRPFWPYTKRLRLDPDVPLLRARGITPQTAPTFEAGEWPLAGFLERCVAVRLHDLRGHPLGYAGRRTRPDEARRLGKWKLPPGLPRTELLFNWHRARSHHCPHVVVVEGPFDAMRVWQAGHRAVVALLGCSPTPTQLPLLASASPLVVMLDGDRAGREGARKLASLLPPHRVRLAHLPHGTDPADLPEPALRRLLASFSS